MEREDTFSPAVSGARGRHAFFSFSEPCPSPAPAERTGRRRHSEKIQKRKSAGGSRPGLHFKPRSRAFKFKRKSLTAKAQGAR